MVNVNYEMEQSANHGTSIRCLH